jgi:flagellar basal-body rod protein FlgG
MKAQQFYMDTISNNLSNVNTHSYKKQQVQFKDLMYQTIREPGSRNPDGAMAPSGIEVGTGVRVGGTNRKFTQGSIIETGNDFDMAISGDGFFQIQLPNGDMVYTRDGHFNRSSDGSMVTNNGYYVYPEITVPEGYDRINVTEDGYVTAIKNGESDNETIDLGQMELAKFVNNTGLKSIGDNMYAETVSSGEAITGVPGEDGFGRIKGMSVEESNVDMVDEMVGMITAQRAYEIVSKAITVSEEMIQTATNLKR